MRALVTGAGGFLGRALCAALSKEGARVRAVSRGPVVEDDSGIEWRMADLGQDPDWTGLLADIDVVYHLAWSTTPATAARAPAAEVAENVVATLSLLEAAAKRARLRIVFPSSGGAVYGPVARPPAREDYPTQPIGAHGAAKLAVEHYLDAFRRSHGLNCVALRIGNAYGPGQDPSKGLGAVSTFVHAAVRNEPLKVFGDGSIVRDYVHLDDVTGAMMVAGSRWEVTGPVNIGSGEGRSILDVVATLQEILGRRLEVRHGEARAFDVPRSVLDISRARRELGWRPQVAFADGVRALLADARAGST